MPIIDGNKDWGDDDDDKKKGGAVKGWKEFDCPDCNANNPSDPPFRVGDEVLCNYCGSSFDVREGQEGKFKLKAK
jgi:transcription elongation factor Elf1